MVGPCVEQRRPPAGTPSGHLPLHGARDADSKRLVGVVSLTTGTPHLRYHAPRALAGCREIGDLGHPGLMQLRRLEIGDEEIATQACRVFGAEGDLDPGSFLSRPEATLIVAEEGDRVVGWVYGHELVHPDGERTMLLYALDVEEVSRRQGYGRSLVTAFVDHARSRGITEVWLLTDDGNPAGLATYRSAGGSRDHVDQVMFTWKLSEGRHS